jgi:hypothetical protein
VCLADERVRPKVFAVASRKGTQRKDALALRWSDMVITGYATLGATYVVLNARWLPGWESTALVLGLLAVGPTVLRALARAYPRQRWWEVLASFWLLPAAVFGHGALGTIADSLHGYLFDSVLARADLRLFHQLPSQVLGAGSPAWLNNLLLPCYYAYFFLPVSLGVLLYLRREREIYDHYVFMLACLYAVNFSLYLMVPAIGPRFYLGSAFSSPLHGSVANALSSLMMLPTFTQDCFPSGHTAIALTVMSFAYTYARRFFWVALPVAAGLVAATLVGRFHYGIDLLCAIPLTVLVRAMGTAVARVSPSGRVSPAREPVRA